jgi:ATP-dependent 26S proteasome regulatory subunit
MEQYRGLAILTSNMRNALDQAFLRRLRFIIEFPFPDAAQRAQIWRRVFPADVPLGAIDWARLAKLNVPGGAIRNIALSAAFIAADAGAAIEMPHLARAARAEYRKLEKPLSDAELA